MTAWELRQAIESSMLWWHPFALVGIVAFIAFAWGIIE
jgi:hypothetical protein